MAWFRIAGNNGSAVSGLAASFRSCGLHEGASTSADEPGVLLVTDASVDIGDEVTRQPIAGRVLVVLPGEVCFDPWTLLESGADDAVVLDQQSDVGTLLAKLERWSVVDEIVESDQVKSIAIGDAPRWTAVLREVVEIAKYSAAPVLVCGETGTGKEVVARLVHALDPRVGDLVLLDCTTIVPSLSGSEFFGHEKGAFTGATGPRAGAFELANRGTLFLDEVGELPSELQSALLRVVQERAFKRVGGSRWQSASFRLLSATNRDLLAEQEAGRFRQDLYFRLAVTQVCLPPLRDRLVDIVPLFRHFFAQARDAETCPEIDPAVARLLMERRYPGNIRDLRQLACRVATRHVGHGPITPGDVPPGDRPLRTVTSTRNPCGTEPFAEHWSTQLESAVRAALSAGVGLKQLKAVVPQLAVSIAQETAAGPAATARMLGVSRRAIDYRSSGQRISHPQEEN